MIQIKLKLIDKKFMRIGKLIEIAIGFCWCKVQHIFLFRCNQHFDYTTLTSVIIYQNYCLTQFQSVVVENLKNAPYFYEKTNVCYFFFILVCCPRCIIWIITNSIWENWHKYRLVLSQLKSEYWLSLPSNFASIIPSHTISPPAYIFFFVFSLEIPSFLNND